MKALWFWLRIFALASAIPLHLSADPSRLERAHTGYSWTFPRDHGAHPTFQTEWWYYTGQLYEEDKEPFREPPAFGYQLTFFRRSLTDRAGPAGYLAHAVITDVTNKRCRFASRSGGEELALAGSSEQSLSVWLGEWSAELIGDTHVLRFEHSARKSDDLPSFVRILARAAGAPLLQGENGFSRKAACEGCASMYYSLPAMTTEAVFMESGIARNLRGVSWMDHEFMTNSLSNDQVGWDWMGLMFRTGERLMVFRLRRKDGGVDFASGTLVKDGKVQALSAADFSVTPGRTWSSDATKASYPVSWEVAVPGAGIRTTINARVDACEIGDVDRKDATIYWEGPVAAPDESVIGYLEMTGYAGEVKL